MPSTAATRRDDIAACSPAEAGETAQNRAPPGGRCLYSTRQRRLKTPATSSPTIPVRRWQPTARSPIARTIVTLTVGTRDKDIQPLMLPAQTNRTTHVKPAAERSAA